MKGERIFIVLLFAILLVACKNEPEMNVTWHKSAAIPSPRACAAVFVVNDQAYIFAGRDSAGVHLNDLWRYTPTTDTWDNLGATPMIPRVNAVACVHNGVKGLRAGYGYGYGVQTS